jgi:hypothetical protein
MATPSAVASSLEAAMAKKLKNDGDGPECGVKVFCVALCVVCCLAT